MDTGTLAPWLQQQLSHLLQQKGHAWLLQGPSGLGQYGLGLALAAAWLCDGPTPAGACGNCPSCHAIEVRTHADLMVLMPEIIQLELGWPLPEKAQADIDDKKRKPSKEIRVEAMRDAVEFCQRTSARGRGKVLLVYPAEDMNLVTANALLKTLEEPPGDVRFVLASEAAHELLPTIRSRCLTHTLRWPTDADSLAWLSQQGLNASTAQSLLKASGGRPEDARAFHANGLQPEAWSRWPKSLLRGDPGVLADWPAPQVIESFQKLCHDLMAVKAGAAARYFPEDALPPAPGWTALNQWAKRLQQAARTAEHPFNPGLMLEALVSEAQSTLASARATLAP